MERKLEISQTLAQAIHDYLVSRPMIEVERLVARIRQCKPVEPILGNE